MKFIFEAKFVHPIKLYLGIILNVQTGCNIGKFCRDLCFLWCSLFTCFLQHLCNMCIKMYSHKLIPFYACFNPAFLNTLTLTCKEMSTRFSQHGIFTCCYVFTSKNIKFNACNGHILVNNALC